MLEIEVQQVKDKRLKSYTTFITKRIIEKIISLTIEKAASKEFIGYSNFTVRFTNSSESRSLNGNYRKKNFATNVLTFSYEKWPNIIADIVICLPVIYTESEKNNISRFHHLTHMLVHGTLHAVGYDHEIPSDAKNMEKLEEKILRSLGIDSPYD